jgi:hypothetical protein
MVWAALSGGEMYERRGVFQAFDSTILIAAIVRMPHPDFSPGSSVIFCSSLYPERSAARGSACAPTTG